MQTYPLRNTLNIYISTCNEQDSVRLWFFQQLSELTFNWRSLDIILEIFDVCSYEIPQSLLLLVKLTIYYNKQSYSTNNYCYNDSCIRNPRKSVLFLLFETKLSAIILRIRAIRRKNVSFVKQTHSLQKESYKYERIMMKIRMLLTLNSQQKRRLICLYFIYLASQLFAVGKYHKLLQNKLKIKNQRMRTSPISIDMDFRIIPSTVPLQSPSPDRKSLNFITPTISPNTLEIKKSSTPINTKNYRYQRYQKLERYQKHDRQKQNTGLFHELERQTQSKYSTQSFVPSHTQYQINTQSHSHNTSQNQSINQGYIEYSSALKQKDEVIKNLKNVIQTMAQNNLYKRINGQQQKQLRNEVKILTIQNQKLVNIIEKLSKKNEINSNNNTFSHTLNNNTNPSIFSLQSLNNTTNAFQNSKTYEQYENKIEELMRTIKQNQQFYEEQAKQIKRFNKSLNAQCKNLQNSNKELQSQNKKLMKILKQKNQGDKIGTMKLSDSSQPNEQPPNQLTTNKSQQKLTLMKIRQQHSQNLKMLKEGLIKQIQQTFDTMKIALQGMNSKVTALAKRLQSIQKMTWQRIRKSHTQTQTITVTIKQTQTPAQIEPEGSAQTDRTFKPQKKNNSQIYIEQCPSSSHDRASRDQFSRMQQVSSNKNLHNPLQQQLEAVKNELMELRIRYKKLSEDPSPSVLSYSRSQTNTNRSESVQLNNLQQKFRITRDELDQKSKQINSLYIKIREIEQDNLRQIQKKNEVLKQKIKENAANRTYFDQKMSEIEQKTSQQVQMLVQNYQKQLQMLRKQNTNLKLALENKDPEIDIQKSELSALRSKGESLQHKNLQLTDTNKKIMQQLLTLELKFESEHKKFASMGQDLLYAKKKSEQDLKNKQEMELQLILRVSEVNQLKDDIQTLKLEVSSKNKHMQNMKSAIEDLEDNHKKQAEKNVKIQQLLFQKSNQLDRTRKLIVKIGYQTILQRVQEIENLLKIKLPNQSQVEQTEELQIEQIYLNHKRQKQRLEDQIEKLQDELKRKQQQIVYFQFQISQLKKKEQKWTQKIQQQKALYKQSANKIEQLQKKLLSKDKSKLRQNEKRERLLRQKQQIINRLGDIKIIQRQRMQSLKNSVEVIEKEEQESQDER